MPRHRGFLFSLWQAPPSGRDCAILTANRLSSRQIREAHLRRYQMFCNQARKRTCRIRCNIIITCIRINYNYQSVVLKSTNTLVVSRQTISTPVHLGCLYLSFTIVRALSCFLKMLLYYLRLTLIIWILYIRQS